MKESFRQKCKINNKKTFLHLTDIELEHVQSSLLSGWKGMDFISLIYAFMLTQICRNEVLRIRPHV